MAARFRPLYRTAASAPLLIAVWASAAIADERAFGEHCAKCHGHAISVVQRLTGKTIEERSAALDRFLETHHAQESKVRAAIVGYLVSLSAR
jgi:hypothetical protein